MGTGWAVGSAAALGASLALVPFLGVPPPGPQQALWPLALLLVYAAWAYAIAQSAYGSKGALASLLGFAVLWALLPLVDFYATMMTGRPDATSIMLVRGLSVLGGLAAIAGIVPELRARRGAIQWGTTIFFLAPLLVGIALRFALGLR